MQKIFNYILKGQGLGIKYLLVFSLVISIALAIFIKIEGTTLVPYAQSIADQMLPIKIENGVIVEPIDTLKVAQLKIDDSAAVSIPLILDTRIKIINSEDLNQLKDGLYITQTTVYSINKGQIKIQPLAGTFDIPQGDYTDFFKKALTYTSIFIGISAIFFLFIFYFIASMFYALCAQLIGAICGKKYNFDQRMRIAVLSFISCYTVVYLLELLTRPWGSLAFFAIVIATEILVIIKLPKPEPDVINTEASAKTKEESKEE